MRAAWAASWLGAATLAVACGSSYGSREDAPPAPTLDASAADVAQGTSDAGGDAGRFCDSVDAGFCLDFDGPPNPVWLRERRESGGTVEVDTSLGNPGASLHASMPPVDAGVAARALNEINFPVHDTPILVDFDVYVKKPNPPLASSASLGILTVYWDPAAVNLIVGPSNVDSAGNLLVMADTGSSQYFLQKTPPFPFDTWVHLQLEAKLSSNAGHVKVTGPGYVIEENPPAALQPAKATILSVGIGRYVGATPQLDVWFDNLVVTFP